MRKAVFVFALLVAFSSSAIYAQSDFASALKGAFSNLGNNITKNFAKPLRSSGKTSSLGSDTDRDLGDLFTNLTEQKQLDAYRSLFRKFLKVCSFGFFIATILKFKQYKDNPTQIPISTPFAFLLVAVLALASEKIIAPTTMTLFGDKPQNSCTGLPGTGNCD